MPCDQPRDRLGAYLDGELSEADRATVARHIAGCPECAALVAALRETSVMVSGLGREPMPTGLSSRLQQTLARASGEPNPTAVRRAPPPQPAVRGMPPRSTAPRFLQQAAVLLMACLLSSLATWWFVTGADRASPLSRDLLSAHLRSLMQDSPIQVASSDSHTVKPWFAGKVDFSPEVRDLTAEGYPLLGGRLDSIAGRRVGALVYKRRLHLINVFAWGAPGTPDAAPALTVRKGYNLLSWTRNGVTYAAVSDLDAAELGRLPDLL